MCHRKQKQCVPCGNLYHRCQSVSSLLTICLHWKYYSVNLRLISAGRRIPLKHETGHTLFLCSAVMCNQEQIAGNVSQHSLQPINYGTHDHMLRWSQVWPLWQPLLIDVNRKLKLLQTQIYAICNEQEILTLEKRKPENVWDFFLINDFNNKSNFKNTVLFSD